MVDGAASGCCNLLFAANLCKRKPQVPCYFIFGDSFSDSGNDNNLTTAAKANYFPYGIDFPRDTATGRFANNFPVPDYLYFAITGARKFALVGVGRIGFLPSQRSTNGECSEDKNQAGAMFDSKLRLLVDQLNSRFLWLRLLHIFVNTTAITTLNPQFLGLLKFQESPCCSTLSSIGQCVVNETSCEDGEERVFMGGFHNTNAANRIIAESAYSA